jgi:hypothetical protein
MQVPAAETQLTDAPQDAGKAGVSEHFTAARSSTTIYHKLTAMRAASLQLWQQHVPVVCSHRADREALLS